MHCWHGIRWYMGLAELRHEIDQLAKLKMNVFQFYWGMGGPWAEFSYDGKVAEISGNKESGFVAWPGASGTAEQRGRRPGVFSGRRVPRSARVRRRPNAGGSLPHGPRVPPRSHSLRPHAQGPGLADDGRDSLSCRRTWYRRLPSGGTVSTAAWRCRPAIRPCWTSGRPRCEA